MVLAPLKSEMWFRVRSRDLQVYSFLDRQNCMCYTYIYIYTFCSLHALCKGAYLERSHRNLLSTLTDNTLHDPSILCFHGSSCGLGPGVNGHAVQCLSLLILLLLLLLLTTTTTTTILASNLILTTIIVLFLLVVLVIAQLNEGYNRTFSDPLGNPTEPPLPCHVPFNSPYGSVPMQFWEAFI